MFVISKIEIGFLFVCFFYLSSTTMIYLHGIRTLVLFYFKECDQLQIGWESCSDLNTSLIHKQERPFWFLIETDHSLTLNKVQDRLHCISADEMI